MILKSGFTECGQPQCSAILAHNGRIPKVFPLLHLALCGYCGSVASCLFRLLPLCPVLLMETKK